MTNAICRPPTSRAITARPPRNRARRAIATLALLLPLAASEARAVIGFVKNIGTSSSATTGTTIAVTVPAAGVATVQSPVSFGHAELAGSPWPLNAARSSEEVPTTSDRVGGYSMERPWPFEAPVVRSDASCMPANGGVSPHAERPQAE